MPASELHPRYCSPVALASRKRHGSAFRFSVVMCEGTLLFLTTFGAPRIELGLSAPKADVLPVYYAPFIISRTCFMHGRTTYLSTDLLRRYKGHSEASQCPLLSYRTCSKSRHRAFLCLTSRNTPTTSIWYSLSSPFSFI